MTDENEDQKGPYKDGNTDANGDYIVGKNKPPEDGKFRKDDGRKRGRRKKGTNNLATDFREEMNGRVSMKVNGKERRVSRQRAIVMRLADNASRGQNAAIKTIMSYSEKFGDGVGEKEDSEDEAEVYPNMSDLSDDEFENLSYLLHKAMGTEPPEPPVRTDPLAYMSDRNDERNYHIDNTVEGISIRTTHFDDVEDEIVRLRNRAYVSAVLPLDDGCCRRRF